MRFKKTTLAALCLAFASAAAYAAAGDRFFSNPTSNKDVVIQVNKAGVTTDVVKAEGATGAVTVGPTAGATHKIFVSDSVNGLELRKSGGTYGQGFRFDVFGTEARIISTGDVAGSLKFYTGGTDVGGFSTSGAWTLGPSGFTGDHTINGSLILAGKAAGGPAATLIGVSGSVDDGLKLQRTAGLPTQVGYVSQRGGALRFTSREDSNYGGFVFTQWNGTTEINAGIVDGTGIWKNAAGTWTVSSDKRLKKNIVTMEGALDRINALHPVTFDWIEDKPAVSKPRAGFIAQEVENIMPGIVKKSSYTYKKDGQEFSIKDAKHLDLGSEMFANLVQAIQELSAENAALKFRLTALEADRRY